MKYKQIYLSPDGREKKMGKQIQGSGSKKRNSQ